MKITVFVTGGLLLLGQYANAQVINPKQTAKQKAEQRANSKTDQTIDKGLDKLEEGINGLFKKKNKKTSEAPDAGGKSSQVSDTAVNATSANAPAAGSGNPSFKTYSKFDFISGEKILYYADFKNTAIGDFPADINTNASGEVVTTDGSNEHWLNLTKNGCFIPEGIGVLPENFTLELSAGIIGDPSNNMTGFGFNFNTDKNNLMQYSFIPGSFVCLHPGAAAAYISMESADVPLIENNLPMPQWDVAGNRFVRISLWRQGQRLRVYANENKLADIPRFFIEKKPYHLSFFRNFFNECSLLLTDVKFAAGAPDTRNKLLTDGKWVTRGILFDVNTDKIKAGSYPALKEIAAVLTENPALQVKITGHTDSDGDEKANLLLSQKRAAAVKAMLTAEFGIAAGRMQTEGKGEAAPSDSNATAEGKANNRRVEFIKL